MSKRLFFTALFLCALPVLAKPPKLTLFLSVDSLGSDLLLRNRARLKGGLGQLLSQGAYFPTVKLDYAECVTAAGHTTVVTGVNPSTHSINSNNVFNPSTGKAEPIFSDSAFPVLEAPLKGAQDSSPRKLLAETLADRLRLATQGKGKALSVTAKGRSAIAMAGHLGQAYWFHRASEKFVTGTYYMKELPEWVRDFNKLKMPESYFGKTWDLAGPPKEYVGEDNRAFEEDYANLGKVFPHPLTGGLPSLGAPFFRAFEASPMMNETLVAFAKAAIEKEALGRDDVPDMLFVGFSAVDHIYHHFGPYSWEMQDALVRLDKSLGELIAVAEKAAGGASNLLVVLTGDHGGSAIPEEWAAQGLEAARIFVPDLQKKVNQELADEWKIPELISYIEEIDVSLNHKAIADKKLDLSSVRRSVAAALARQPGIQLALSREQLFEVGADETLRQSLRAGFHPLRSGDVLIITRVYHVLNDEPFGASHGTPYAYDSQIPLVLYGKGVRAGYYPQEAKATSIAPTVSAILSFGPPAQSASGPLSEALRND